MKPALKNILHPDCIYVGGSWVPPSGSDRIDVIEPRTGQVFGSVPRGTAGDVDAAARAARRAFESWSGTDPKVRAQVASAVAGRLVDRTEEFAELIARELGMPLDQSRAIQVGLAITDFSQVTDSISEIEWETTVRNSRVMRVPMGVVGAITPWNYPLHQVTTKVAGAMAAGCTVVLKPSELTPLTAYLFADVLNEVGVPDGVFNLVPGTGVEVGEPLVAHPEIDMISFTGSTRAGRRISEIASASVKPVTLELGGKSAAVFLDHSTVERGIEVSFTKGFQNCGQTCSALTRFLVPRKSLQLAEEVAARVAATYTPGDPFDPSSKLGPLVSEAQLERVRSYIQRGISEGAKLVVGGTQTPMGLEQGYYVAPTVFSEVTSEMAVAQEEIFGPVLVIMPFEDEEDAVRIANNSDYGLAGAVWAEDQERAVRVAKRIRTGQVSINGGLYNPVAPFGGFKRSGHGRENGRFGLEEYLTYASLQF